MDLNGLLRLSEKEYYLWTRGVTHNRLPWKRSLLNLEFLEYEKKLVNEAFEWRSKFIKVDPNQELPELTIYTIPVKLSADWESEIKNKGHLFCIGLSALQNTPQANLLALFDANVAKICPPYQLIRITKSRKIVVTNKRLNVNEPFLLIEDWEPLKSDTIYVDLPYEKNYVGKIIAENLTSQEDLKTSFESPLVSSPMVLGSSGGIALSSLASSYTFSLELIKTLLKMVPPEYRAGIRPPERVYKGVGFKYITGIDFFFAERPYNNQNSVSGVIGHSLNNFMSELDHRNEISSEYSIFSSINPPNSIRHGQIWTEIFNNFSKSEITIPYSLDDLRESDIDLTRVDRAINESLWLQIVGSRQLNPVISSENELAYKTALSRLKQDFDVQLSDQIKDDMLRYRTVGAMLNNQNENVRRLVQSFARAQNRSGLNDVDFQKARNLTVENFGQLLQHQDFANLGYRAKEDRSNRRFNLLQTELISHPKSSLTEIYDLVRSSDLFDDLADLQRMLNWLVQKGEIFKNSEDKYTWL